MGGAGIVHAAGEVAPLIGPTPKWPGDFFTAAVLGGIDHGEGWRWSVAARLLCLLSSGASFQSPPANLGGDKLGPGCRADRRTAHRYRYAAAKRYPGLEPHRILALVALPSCFHPPLMVLAPIAVTRSAPTFAAFASFGSLRGVLHWIHPRRMMPALRRCNYSLSTCGGRRWRSRWRWRSPRPMLAGFARAFGAFRSFSRKVPTAT